MAAPCCEQCAGEQERVRGEDVVVGEAMDEQERPGELACSLDERGA